MSEDSARKTALVALGLCLICSLLVSSVAVSLNSRQSENKRLDTIKNILVAADLYGDDTDVARVYEDRVTPILIDLATGDSVAEEQQDERLLPDNFNIKTVATDALLGRSLPQEKDTARIGRVPSKVVVYEIREAAKLQKLILPVYGKGLWSTMYGFVALGADLLTVTGITFYEHGETPGLGGEIDNSLWQQQWKGKVALDGDGLVLIKVIKGRVDPTRPEARNQVDGLSGATITTRGVDLMVSFWLGQDGYGPLLSKLREKSDG